MKIWYYNELSKELIGDGIALENPEHKGDYMLPMFATFIEPLPYKDNYKIIFKNNVWSYDKIIEEKIEVSENKNEKIKNNFYCLIYSPVEYINGLKYKPIWKDKLINLYIQMFDDETVKIYDITKLEKNSLNMTKPELKGLIIFLRDRYEFYYQEMNNKLEH